MATFLILLSAIIVSTIAVAFVLSRHAREDSTRGKIRGALRFVSGPFPLSIAFHVTILLLLIITVHESRGRELIMVNLEAGGGGGGSEMQNLDLPEVPMPEMAPQMDESPHAVDTSKMNALADSYVRAPNGSGIGIGGGGGIGTSYGRGIGNGFGGYIGDLRRKGLDVAIVIDGTGSMRLIIEDVKARMNQIVLAIHRLVPIARFGIVVYGGHGETIDMQPFTLSPVKLQAFLDGVQAKGGGEWEEDTLDGLRTAVDKMDWRPYAHKVIVLVGDSPPAKADFQPILALIGKFRDENGIVNTIDVAAEEHERFELELSMRIHRKIPDKISPLPEFYRQTESAYTVLAKAGGGSMKSLSHEAKINQQVLVLAFGDKWEEQLKFFSTR